MNVASNADGLRSEHRRREYFFDYNTVEQILLACAIFVCVAGVMFESDRFTESGPQASSAARYRWMRESITYFTIIVVLFSFVYYATVFASEVAGYTPKFLKKLFANKKSALESATELLQERKDTEVVMSMVNPAHAAYKGVSVDEHNRLLEEQRKQQDLIEKLAKQNSQARNGKGAFFARKLARRKKKQKKEFQHVQPQPEIELNAISPNANGDPITSV